MITDVMEYCSNRVPKWNTISISGYHIREAGSTAAWELAFTLANGPEYAPRNRPRYGRRRLRPAALVLRQPPRLLRGDREVPRRAPHLGSQAARGVLGQGPASGCSASTPGDRGRVPDGPCSRRTTSCGPPSRRWPWCSAGPSPCTPTRWTRPPAAHREGGQDRAPAGHRRGDRGRPRRRSAGRLLLRGGHDRSPRGRGRGLLRGGREAGAVPSIEAGYFQKEIHDSVVSYQRAVERGASASWGQLLHRGRRTSTTCTASVPRSSRRPARTSPACAPSAIRSVPPPPPGHPQRLPRRQQPAEPSPPPMPTAPSARSPRRCARSSASTSSPRSSEPFHPPYPPIPTER